MAYRFKQGETLEKAVRRISAEQVRRAMPQLEAGTIPPASIHDVRKATKRLKSLLRAVRPALPPKTFRARYDAAGEVADLLSQARDNFILFETIGKLEQDAGADALQAFEKLKALLGAWSGGTAADIDAESVAKAHWVLEKEVKKLGKLKLSARGMPDFFDGVEHVYALGRLNLRKVYKKPSDERFHELRKATQWHWRHMALISRCWPEYFSVRIAAGRELAQLLGDEHDLSVLRLVVAARSDELGGARGVIETIAGQRQEILRRAVQGRAERYFAEKPRAFRRRIEAYWSAEVYGQPPSEPLAQPACAVSPAPAGEQPAAGTPRLASKAPALSPSQGKP